MEKFDDNKQTKKKVGGNDAKTAAQKYETNEAGPLPDKKETATVQEAPLEPLPPKRILVIDDEPSIRNLLSKIFKKAGYEVMLASSGKDGLQLFRENPADLIITDIVMPEMSGHDFIIDLKKDYPDVKIIAISGNQYVGPEIELSIAEAFGAVKVFAKPFKASEILNAVKTLLRQTSSLPSESKG